MLSFRRSLGLGWRTVLFQLSGFYSRGNGLGSPGAQGRET